MLELSDLTWWQWVIFLVPTAMLLIALPLWLLWLGRRPTIPDGTRYTMKRGPYTIDVVFSDTTAPGINKVGASPARTKAEELIAHTCAAAVWAAGSSWAKQINSNVSVLHHVVVRFVPEAVFLASPFPSIQTAAAYLAYTGAPVGAGIPAAVVLCSKDIIDDLMLRGEPVIHEMLHALLGEFSEPDKDRDHSHHEAWLANSQADSVQWHAQQLFRKA